jgi:hypothetical protein
MADVSRRCHNYLVEHSADAMPDPFLERLIGAAIEVRTTQPNDPAPFPSPLTDAELRCRSCSGSTRS